MAFPGMSAPGLGGDAGLDEQKLKEQQMIKFVRAWPIPEQTSSAN
jgi:import inner membrane translocase subunit TIM22